jgi:FdhD protein
MPQPHSGVAAVALKRWDGASASFSEAQDFVAVESPLEIRVGEESLATTMRTPGHDDELVAGLLWAEGVLAVAADLVSVKVICNEGSTLQGGGYIATATVSSIGNSKSFERAKRGTLTSAACGVCGRGAIDDLIEALSPIAQDTLPGARSLSRLTSLLSSHQGVFAKTGGLHASALVNEFGSVLVAREDVGRHNAVDKVVGRMVLDQAMPLLNTTLVVSGRTSFEIVQKAIRAGVGVVVGVSAPSSLAVQLAEAFGVLLLGFARNGSFNAYSQLHRLSE